MTRLLHISASPRDPASESLARPDAFLQAHQAARPDVQVDHLDLFDGTLPEFGRLAAGAKMAVLRGGQPSPDRAAAWNAARTVFDRFAGDMECPPPGQDRARCHSLTFGHVVKGMHAL